MVFDLRGTGYSDGEPDDTNFQADLYAIASWAKERFGRINFGFLGTPSSEYGTVNFWPLSDGTMAETYHYRPPGNIVDPRSILYLSTYGNFSTSDDAICASLADAGYSVFGLDPLRYLLHASAKHLLTPENLWDDIRLLSQMLPSAPIIVGQPLASGLAIMWAAGSAEVRGVIAIGRAQIGMRPSHIFQNKNPYNYLLHRYTPRITPRPIVYIMNKAHAMGGDEDEMATLYQNSKDPRRIIQTDKLSVSQLHEAIVWVEHNYSPIF
jgi:pimeloyl-ACP methyl ester carboxylesterase